MSFSEGLGLTTVERPAINAATAPHVAGRAGRLSRSGLLVELLAVPGCLAIGALLLHGLAPATSAAITWRAALLLGATCCLALVAEVSRTRGVRRLAPSLLTAARESGGAICIGMVAAAVLAPLTAGGSALLETNGAVTIMALPLIAIAPFVRWTRARMRFSRRERAVIVGAGTVAEALRRRLARRSSIEVVATVDDYAAKTATGVSELDRLCRTEQIDRVIVAFSRTPARDQLEMLRRLHPGVAVSVVPRMYEVVNWQSDIEDLDGLPLVHLSRPLMTVAGRATKRTMDLVLASISLCLLAPLLLVAAIAVKLESPGPVFFRQERTGRRGRVFRIVKFRTMCTGAEAERAALQSYNEIDGPIFKMAADPRVTRVGRWLRRTSIDELPQLLNVLRGEMSLVGPRPFPVAEAEQMAQWTVPRTDMPPGITGLWQISGRNDLSYDDLHALDSLYVSSWSVWLDIRILLQTPGRVLRRSGAY